MRLRIRNLLLTVALLCGLNSTASACCFIPLLDPFHWLFGCSRGCGGSHGGAYGCENGYGFGGGGGWHGGNPYATQRFIDDWLGYGYLRDQQGTLGHYPGRPFGGYQPHFPQLFAHNAPCTPALALPGPMVAPLQSPMMMPAPMPTMHNPCFDPCQQPCVDPCIPAPLVQCQQMPLPVTTWRPMTVDRGHWARVWVPRPITTMVPQTQFMAAAPMLDSGCGDDCGSASGGEYGTMIPGMMMPGVNSSGPSYDPGCCGSESGNVDGMSSFAIPQSTMMTNPGMSSYGPQYAATVPYTSMGGWYTARPVTAWSPSGANPTFANRGRSLPTMPMQAGRRHHLSRREVRILASQSGAPYGTYPQTAQWPSGIQYGQPMSGRTALNPAMYGQPMNGQPAFPQPAQYGWQTSPMMGAYQAPAYSMLPSPMMPGSAITNPYVYGDIMGDHELAPASSAAVPVIQNGFSGTLRLVPATWTNFGQSPSTRQYQNSVR